MPDYADSIASSLLNPDSEDEERRNLIVQGLSVINPLMGPYSRGYAGAVREFGGMSPEERRRAGLLGTAYRVGRAGLEAAAPSLPDVGTALFGETPTAPSRPIPPRVPPSSGMPEPTPEPTPPPPSGGGIGVRWVDGKPVFTNIDVSPGERADYRKGVQAFRDEASIHDDAVAKARELGRMPRSSISATGIPRKVGDFTVRQGTPIGAAGVSQPFMADPTQELGETDWASMGPLAQEEYARQVGGVSGVQQARAGTRLAEAQAGLAEHEEKMGSDLDYLMARRAPFYQKFVNMAKVDPEVQDTIQKIMDEYSKMSGAQPGTPDYAAKQAAATREAVTAYLMLKYNDVARWDDVLSRNLGLTI